MTIRPVHFTDSEGKGVHPYHLPPDSYHFNVKGRAMVYVVKSDNAVKIGYTQDNERLERRLSSLQVGNPVRIELLAVAELAGPRAEKALHEAFDRHRIRGEWYSYKPGIQKFVAAVNVDPRLNVFDWLRQYNRAVARLDRINVLTERRRREREAIKAIVARDKAAREAAAESAGALEI